MARIVSILVIGLVVFGLLAAISAKRRDAQIEQNTKIAAASPQPGKLEEQACKLKDIKYIDAGEGVDFSRDGTQIVYDKRDKDKNYQIWTSRVDGASKKCLTCNKSAGGPDISKNKGFAKWHPSGKYIYFVAEQENYVGLKELTTPGTSWWNNLWIVTVDGSRYFKLTDMYNGVASPENPTGILMPQFSKDGKKVFWAERIGDAKPREEANLAKWRLATADFVDGENPKLLNKKTFNPGGVFFEAHTFHPFDPNTVLFASDIKRSTPYPGNRIDIFKYNLSTGNLVNLTNDDKNWDEHAVFSPDGKKIAWGSSKCCEDYNPVDVDILSKIPKKLQLDVFLMDQDGSNKTQLTHFNNRGYREFNPTKSQVFPHSWSPDGTKLGLTQQLKFPDRNVLILNFEGPCGKQ